MLNLFMFSLLIVAILQKGEQRRVAALCVAIPVLIVHIVDSKSVVHDDYYYLMTATADAISIVLLTQAKVMDRFVMALIDVCCLFFVVQIIGCIIYFCDIQHAAYNFSCLALYFVLIAILMTKDAAIDGGYNSTARYILGLWASIRPSRLLISASKEEVRA